MAYKLIDMKKKVFVEIISSLFILLFAYTALSKLYDPAKFQWALEKSPLIHSFSGIFTYAIPVIELTVATLLFFPKTRKKGLYSSLGLMTIFTLYIGYMLLFTPKLPCSCGGVIQQMNWNQHLLFNLGFTLLAGIGIALHTKPGIIAKRQHKTKAAYI
jgi:hypothetical protein